MGLFIFNKTLISSRSADDGAADVDLFAIPVDSLANITSTEGVVTLYFKEGNSFKTFAGGGSAIKGYELAQVDLTVNAGTEHSVVVELGRLTNDVKIGKRTTINIDVANENIDVLGVTGITTIKRFNTFSDIEAGTGVATIGNFKFESDQSVGAGQDNFVLTYDNSDEKISLEAASGVTYGVSCVDGDNTDEEKIRLTGSDSTTDDVVLEAAGSLTIARSSDKITLTNDRFDIKLKGDYYPPANTNQLGFGFVDISANYWYGGVFEVAGQMSITHIGIQTKSTDDTDHQIVCGIYKYVYSSDSWTKVVQVGPFTEGVNGKQAIALGSTEVLAQGLYMSVLLADGTQQNMGGIYVAQAQPLVPMAMANSRAGFYLFDNSYTYNATLPSTVASGALSVWEYNGHTMPSPFVTLG